MVFCVLPCDVQSGAAIRGHKGGTENQGYCSHWSQRGGYLMPCWKEGRPARWSDGRRQELWVAYTTAALEIPVGKQGGASEQFRIG